MAFKMSELIRLLVEDGIRRRNPVISPADFTLELIERLLSEVWDEANPER